MILPSTISPWGAPSLETSEVSQTSEVLTDADAAHHLTRAVDGLRQAGQQDHIPRGLLARAAFYRATGEFERAQRDLAEAMAIATRGGMKLHECDAHLGYVRLYIDFGSLGDFRSLIEEHLAAAKALVHETGYHRRDAELAELEKHLGDTDEHGRDGRKT